MTTGNSSVTSANQVTLVKGLNGGGPKSSNLSKAIQNASHSLKLSSSAKYLSTLAKTQEKFSKQPSESLASTYAKLASVHESLKDFEKVESNLLKSFELNKQLVPKHDARLGLLANALADFYVSRGQDEKSEPFYLHALETLEANNSIDYKAIAYNCQRLLFLYEKNKKYEKMKEILQKMLVYHLGPPTKEIADVFFTFGSLYFIEKKFNLSEENFLKALNVLDQIKAEKVEIAEVLNYLGIVYCENKELDRAEDALRRALDCFDTSGGEGRRKVIHNLAVLYENKRNFKLASQYWKELSTELQELKSNEKEKIFVMNSLASALIKTGNQEESEEILEKSLKLLEKSSDTREKIRVFNLLSIIHSQKNPGKSENLLIQALEMAEQFFGLNHLKVAEIYSNLGSLAFNSQDFLNGEKYFSKALAIQEQVLDFNNKEELAKTYFMMGLLNFNKGDFELSEKNFLKSLSLKTQNDEKLANLWDPMIPKILGNLALISSGSNDFEQALKLYLQCKEIQENSLPGSLDLALTYFHLGLTCFNLEDFEESEKFYLKSLGIQEKVRNSEDPELISLWNNLANTSFMLKKYETSEKFYKKCLELLTKVHGPEHPDTKATLNTLESLKAYL